MVKKEVSSPVPEQGFLFVYMDIFDLEPYELDYIHFGELETIYQDLITERISEEDWPKIRTKDYWEIHDRFHNPKTRRKNHMKLLVYAYLMFMRHQDPNYSHIASITPDERPHLFKLEPNLNFYAERKV
jgi:hypothetical protein